MKVLIPIAVLNQGLFLYYFLVSEENLYILEYFLKICELTFPSKSFFLALPHYFPTVFIDILHYICNKMQSRVRKKLSILSISLVSVLIRILTILSKCTNMYWAFNCSHYFLPCIKLQLRYISGVGAVLDTINTVLVILYNIYFDFNDAQY